MLLNFVLGFFERFCEEKFSIIYNTEENSPLQNLGLQYLSLHCIYFPNKNICLCKRNNIIFMKTL